MQAMAAVEMNHRNSFSIIVKDSKDLTGSLEDKVSGNVAVKYTKSAHSIASKESDGEARHNASASSKDDNAEMAVVAVGFLEEEAASATSIKGQRSPKAKKLSQVGVEDERMCASPSDLSSYTIQLPMKRDKKFKHRKHSLWYRLRRRNVHMGVVEVNSQHPFYNRLQAMSVGVHSMLSDPKRPGPQENLMTCDYTAVVEKELRIHDSSTNEITFRFETYAPAVFATIRRAVSVEEDVYMDSIISQQHAYLEFISNSRSGQDFFLSYNMRYLIKTNKKKDVKYLLSILGEYLQHFLSYPHSLLVKYLGCYSVQLPGKKKIFFLVMQNIFYPADRIDDRFDVKGCTAGRYQQPDPPGSHTITVLKDQNFFQEELELGTNSDWFIDQITADASFLRDLNVMDYSLLIGRQKLQDTERDGQSFPDLVTRFKKSSGVLSIQARRVSATGSALSGKEGDGSLHTGQENLPGSVGNEEILPGVVGNQPVPAEDLPPRLYPGLHFPHSLAEGLENFSCQRRRLLPDCSNALHIVDGPEYRYFFGIVDFLTRWTLRQKTARLWKMVKYGCGEHSTVPPDYYSKRFISFISTRVT